jgi:Protein kinase domain
LHFILILCNIIFILKNNIKGIYMSVLNNCSTNIGNSSCTTSVSGVTNGASKKCMGVKDRIIANLGNFGLSQKEFDDIDQFYVNNRQTLDLIKGPAHIKGKSLTPPLARSLVYLPEGPQKGLYILLKDRGGVKEVGLGSFNRATLALQVETGNKKIFRNARAKDILPNELEANEMTSPYPKYFVSGTSVQYEDSWRQRTGREKNTPKDKIPQEKHVEKTGFLMDFLEGGELMDRLQNNPPRTLKERAKISYKIAKEMAVLHDELKIVHFDLKLQNVFLTAKGTPKIGDFGFAAKIGELKVPNGSPGYIAPELVGSAMNKTDYFADPAADVWSLGCLLADVMHADSWYDWNGQANGDWEKLVLVSRKELDETKKIFFPRWDDVNHPDHLIYRCLMTNPLARPSASQVAAQLENIYKGIPN